MLFLHSLAVFYAIINFLPHGLPDKALLKHAILVTLSVHNSESSLLPPTYLLLLLTTTPELALLTLLIAQLTVFLYILPPIPIHLPVLHLLGAHHHNHGDHLNWQRRL
jgi:hypothetical protein